MEPLRELLKKPTPDRKAAKTPDDNAHFPGTERLMNERIAHNKLFTVLPYPRRSYALTEGENTVRHFLFGSDCLPAPESSRVALRPGRAAEWTSRRLNALPVADFRGGSG